MARLRLRRVRDRCLCASHRRLARVDVVAHDFVLDALEQAIYDRREAGLAALVHHSDRGTQYLSMRDTDQLADAGMAPSVGSRGDAYDHALAESIIGLFKTEVIQRSGPWRHLEAVEFATLTWIDSFNNRRLLEPIGYVPPAEYEANYYQQLEGGGARRHPSADPMLNGTAAEHPQYLLPTLPNEGRMAEPKTNSH